MQSFSAFSLLCGWFSGSTTLCCWVVLCEAKVLNVEYQVEGEGEEGEQGLGLRLGEGTNLADGLEL